MLQDIMLGLLRVDPEERYSIREALAHPFFRDPALEAEGTSNAEQVRSFRSLCEIFFLRPKKK